MAEDSGMRVVLQELERIAVLEATSLLDSPADASFDRFTRLASNILQAPVALVSLVDQQRQFFKSCVGLTEPWSQARQTPLSHSFCKHVVTTSEVLLVEDARHHHLFNDNPAIEDLGLIAYLGIPLTTAQGQTLGTLCVIDSKPRQWSSRDVAILEDLAALVVEEIEFHLLAKHLHANHMELRRLELHRDEMVQMLVHDLRNPMTSFLSGLQLVELTGPLTKRQQEYLTLAMQGGATLVDMLSRILDASKAQSGHLLLELSEVYPARLVEAACDQMRPLAENAGVTLSAKIEDNPLLDADADKLMRVLVNLIGNAIQHTPSQGSIHVTAVLDDTQTAVLFSVIDNGCGIPTDAFSKIFQKYRGDETPRVTGFSTGLGLPFSLMTVEAHGGRIWVQSDLGMGTAFHFTIPLSAAH